MEKLELAQENLTRVQLQILLVYSITSLFMKSELEKARADAS